MSDNYKISVAIVEDIREIRDGLQLLINEAYGLQCKFVYPDAEAALKDLPSQSVDVVLMDITLPGMNGIECISLLKEKMPRTQFMICSVNDDDDNIFNALQTGATGYILKRTQPSQILDAIRDLYAGGAPMSSEIARRVVSSMQKKKKTNTDLELLTEREREILDFLAKGFLYKEIASELFISKETVKKHIHNIYEKLHVQTRTEALNKAFLR
jgi:DNA-binding NarL/FixJ family response regulator